MPSDMQVPNRIASLAELHVFAKGCLDTLPRGAVIGLVGPLGAGKTAFVKAFIEAACLEQGVATPRVVSPSYVLRQSYPELAPPIEHFDWYRLDSISPSELLGMGFWDAVDIARDGFVFVEWADRLSKMVASPFSHHIHISIEPDGARQFQLSRRP